jgi:outer membrane lipase/esterase
LPSYGNLTIQSNRQFNLGIVSQSNTGSTSGDIPSLSLEGGYTMLAHIGGFACQHTPLIGATWQQVNVHGFTETNPAGAPTALSFANQSRRSSVSELGYQLRIDAGKWQPFARLTWNHELASTNRYITTSLTSVSAPSYNMPAIQFGHDWGLGMLGSKLQINATWQAYALISSQFSQYNRTNTTGSVGFNMGL